MSNYTSEQIIGLVQKAAADGVPIQPVGDYIVEGLRAKTAKSVQAQTTKAPWENYLPGAGGPMGESLIVNLAHHADKEIPEWSIYPYRRDHKLRKLWKQEPTMASAIYSMSSRIQSLEYELKAEYGSSKTLRKEYDRLLRDSQFGEGFYVLRQKLIQDMLTQDNGVFIEIVGAGNPAGPLRGIPTQVNHIDSQLAWRTFDPEYPVLYVNPFDNTYHKLHKTRVAFASSMTSPVELARGVGFCGVSRALRNVQYLRDVGIYKHEKVSGRFTRAIGWGKGFTDKQFNEALEGAEQVRKTRGFAVYKNIPFILSARDNAELAMLDLAKLPDGFDFEKEMNLLVYAYSMAFGVDARELWPSTVSGATKADASVQHLKARGKGYADMISLMQNMFNQKVFDPNRGIELSFDQTDDEADLLISRVHGQEIDNLDKMVKMGAIDNEEAREIAIARGLLNKEYLKKNPELMSQNQMFQAKLDAQNAQNANNAGSGKKPDIQDHGGPRNTSTPVRKNEQKEWDEEVPEFTEDELDDAYALYQRLLSGD